MSGYDKILNSIQSTAQKNTAQSQAFAREQMQFNAKQAALNRAWQERMSNTAHQREVTDLIAAGLNPVLSTSHQGASTPTGSAATGAKGEVDETYGQALSAYLGQLVNSATAIQTAQINANAQIQGAALAANATRYAAQYTASATRYAAQYQANMAYKRASDFPTTVAGLVNNSFGGSGGVWKIVDKVTDSLFGLKIGKWIRN